ncbi:CBO0543 family protein [Fredinandcohnia onubensis]|uniref:CBO0543 family protein n=1 Tax=Fredinandcohnia onubensis TaxID=1571209 RepID=UPI00211E8F25|nr:CBO0543 family protein [Fredinandcohnia onubensis]
MNTVKHSKNSNLQQLLKRPFQFWTNLGLLVTVLFGTLIGTYLDLYFVGKGFYSFPERPFPEVFSIHVGFTLLGLPVMLIVFLSICQKLNLFGKFVAVFVFASTMACGEKLSEGFGWLVHDTSWKHVYSLFGYTVYFLLMLVVYYLVTTKKT